MAVVLGPQGSSLDRHTEICFRRPAQASIAPAIFNDEGLARSIAQAEGSSTGPVFARATEADLVCCLESLANSIVERHSWVVVTFGRQYPFLFIVDRNTEIVVFCCFHEWKRFHEPAEPDPGLRFTAQRNATSLFHPKRKTAGAVEGLLPVSRLARSSSFPKSPMIYADVYEAT